MFRGETAAANVSGGSRHLLRCLAPDDYADIKVIMDRIYPGALGGAWLPVQFRAQLSRFPQGQMGIERNGRVVAAAISLIVDYDRFGDGHAYNAIIGDGYLTTHAPQGDVLYGVDLFVHPDYQNRGLGRQLYDARKRLCRELGVRAMVIGGRIPGYAACAGGLSPDEYVERVQRGELHDPILSFQLANGFRICRVVEGYLAEDEASHGCAAILRWDNPRWQG